METQNLNLIMNKNENGEFVVNANNGFEALKQCLDFLNDQLYADSTDWSKSKPKKVRHHDSYIFRGLRRAKDAGLRSGAAIRIEKKYGANYTFIDYINYHKRLIDNARKKFPEDCEGKTDLDILAELQHDGTATCLIDFTYNFFTALWFACNTVDNKKNGNRDEDLDGLVYCLNVNDCLINNESMLVITDEQKEKPIETLLSQTQRFADFDGKYKFKFWYWQPDMFNSRVTAQDGLFIFGMEKFDLERNKVKVLRIKRRSKEMILDVMAKFFDLSVTTIYPDINGYADANNKFMEILDSNWEGQGCMSRGVSYMLQGSYRMALDYFDRFEGCVQSSEKKNCKHQTSNCFFGMLNMMELYYYKAEAFKLNKNYNRAILNYRDVREEYNKAKMTKICKKLGKRGEQLRNRAESRVFTSYSQELLLMYETKRFKEGIYICNEILKKYEHSNINVDYAKISLVELELLNLGYQLSNLDLTKKEKEREMDQCYGRCDKYVKKFQSQIPENGFYALLLYFFELFAKIYCGKEVKYDIRAWIENLWERANQIEGEEKDLICDWYLDDIRSIVENVPHDEKRYSDLYYLMARFNEIQDYLFAKLLKRRVK